MRLRILSWNINSVRLRLPLLLNAVESRQTDVICLQETKCRDGEFPCGELAKRGYVHCALHGQKGYHGTAILSRLPFHEVRRFDFCDRHDARHVCVTFESGAGAANGIVLHNFYVPAGGDEPDPAINPKFAHKLAFLDAMRDWALSENVAAGRAILVGDLNVAPLEADVWNHTALLKVVSNTPIEVDRLNAAMLAGRWIDAMRRLVPPHEKLFTWWSYRSPRWELADKGRRLDHVWLSPPLAPGLRTIEVMREARGWERPSDHVPLVLELDV